jgi:hypothetical protein
VSVNSPRGFYFTPADLTVSAPAASARLAITLDGSEPTTANALPAGSNFAIRITNTTVLRARAFRENWRPSEISTHSFIFPNSVLAQQAPAGAAAFWQDRNDRVPPDWRMDSRVIANPRQLADALLTLPTISLVTATEGLFGAENGIYVHSLEGGPDKIRPASVEFIYPDGRTGFQRDIGLRIRGGASRFPVFSPKHGFGLIFRKEFGPGELDYPVFPTSTRHRFNRLVLRPNVNDSWASTEWPQQRVNGEQRWERQNASYIRDQWVRDSQRAMGQPSAHGIFTHVYLNGLYWGIYNLTERPDDDFAAAYFGGRENEYDVISDGTDLHAGAWTAWRALLRAQGLVDPARYQSLLGNDKNGERASPSQTLLDVTNLVDYMVLHIFIGADDWPDHNWWVARRDGPESTGFKFFAWDQEVSINSLIKQHTGWVVLRGGAPFYAEEQWPNTPAQIYSHCRANAEFRQLFAERVQKHLFGRGALTVQSNIDRWKGLASQLQPALLAESARWGDAYRPDQPYRPDPDWDRVNDWQCKVFFPSNQPIALQRFRNAKLFLQPQPDP